MEEDEYAVVIDCGSGVLKAGFAGDDEPSVTFKSFVGRPRHPGGAGFQDTYVGDETDGSREALSLTYPMEHGIVTNWEDMERIWSHTFKALGVQPAERRVLLTESPLNPKVNRETMAQVMFEVFGSNFLYIANEGILSTFFTGRSAGVAVDIGDGVCYTFPVYHGDLIPHAIRRSDLAGRDLTNYLMEILGEGGYSFTTTAEREVVREIKEKLCYVAKDFHVETASSATYRLRDGQSVGLDEGRFRCPEALFRPSLLGSSAPGLHEMVMDSIQACDIDLRRDLLPNIFLCGGSSLFPGICDRLEREVKALAPPRAHVRVVASPDRGTAVWIGGSIMASPCSFQKMWISKERYEEVGPSVVSNVESVTMSSELN